MARPEYPSDERRRKNRPAIRVHLSVTNHPTYGHVFADPLLRGVIVGIWIIAGRAHVSATNDDLTLTAADVLWITGKERMVDGAKLLRRACEATAYRLRIACDQHANCQRSTCDRAAKWVIHVRNFARKQGFTPPHAEHHSATPHPSESESESVVEEKNMKTSSLLPTTSDLKVWFESIFWSEYPRKRGKAEAWDAIRSLSPDEALREQIVASVRAHREAPDWVKDGGSYIPWPQKWIKRQRWLDDVAQGATGNGSHSRGTDGGKRATEVTEDKYARAEREENERVERRKQARL